MLFVPLFMEAVFLYKNSLLTVVNGGHTWPGADDFNIGLPIGLTSKEININEYIWNFFERLE